MVLPVYCSPRCWSRFSRPGSRERDERQPFALLRILFPGAGLLVLSAWCLGVLNSHGRFFLSYAAPVLWNLAIIGPLLAFGGDARGYRLAEYRRVGLGGGKRPSIRVQLPTVVLS